MNKLSLAAGIVSILISLPAQANEDQQPVDAVVTHLVGIMDTSAQAAANRDKADVRMTTCRVEMAAGESDAVYLYQEQAISDRLDQPYRQRFLQISPGDDAQTVVSTSYRPEAPTAWSGFCEQPEAQRKIESSDLGETVCSVFLEPLISSVYIGKTPPGGCPANVRGAVKITNTIILHADGMDTYDRGFDAQGNQVWGADGESYQFRWLSENNQN